MSMLTNSMFFFFRELPWESHEIVMNKSTTLLYLQTLQSCLFLSVLTQPLKFEISQWEKGGSMSMTLPFRQKAVISTEYPAMSVSWWHACLMNQCAYVINTNNLHTNNHFIYYFVSYSWGFINLFESGVVALKRAGWFLMGDWRDN